LYKKFESLPADRKKRILDVCLEEFALNGYDRASTNSIVGRAGISKGILFHYFGNKKSLYLYILDYAIEQFVRQIHILASDQPGDIFERLKDWGVKKLKIARENPLVYKLIMEAFAYVPDKLEKELQARFAKIYKENLPMFLNGLDKSRFREDINFDRALEIIFAVNEAMGSRILKMYRNQKGMSPDAIEKIFVEEYMESIKILKYGIYRG
jgi:TetR/AcrR family transcriptional regulator